MKNLRLLLPWVTLGVCLQAAQLPVPLSSASTYTVLAGSTITNTGPSIVNGNVGLSPGTAVSGFPPGSIVGTLNVNGPAVQAEADLSTAYNNAAGRTAVPSAVGNVSGNLDGQTLTPGLYNSTSTLGIGVGGILTLSGQGNANAVFIFQIASALTTGSGSQVILTNGANAANIFWQVGSSATLGTNSVFAGTIMAYASVSLATGATLNGRALAETAAVTLDTNSMVNPGPPITTGTLPPLTAVTCPLPGGIVGTAYSSLLVPTGGTPAYTFSITPGSLPPGLTLNAATGAITGTPTTAAGSPFSFTANARDSAAPPVLITNSTCSIAITAATSSADVSIVKTGPANAAALANISYSLAVANAGPGSAAGVTVTDVLPAGTTYVSATSTQGSCSYTSAVTCSLGTMANGGSATITLVVVAPNTSGAVVNTATVVSTTPDPNTANNHSTWTVTTAIAPSADVSIVKTGPTTAAPQANISYNLAVANAGPTSAASVTVTDTLPAGTTYVSATSTQGSCSFTTAVVCSLGTMANGGSATITLVVVGPSTSGAIVNTAAVASSTPDPNLANNQSTWTVTAGVPTVPALSSWGLGALALLLAGYSMLCIRKAHPGSMQ